MEIIYHQNQLASQDWEQINDYLASEDPQNVEIGLILLEQNPRAVIYAEVGLVLTQYLGLEKYQLRARVLINSYLDRKKAMQAANLMQIFGLEAVQQVVWRNFAEQLYIFEKEGNLYARYIANRAHFLPHLATLAHNLLLYKQYPDKSWAYATQVLAQNGNNLRARMCWVELLLRYYFPKKQKWELAENFKDICAQLYQNHSQFRPLMSYYLGVYYTEFETDKTAALYWLQIGEKTAMAMPFYTQILGLIAGWKATV